MDAVQLPLLSQAHNNQQLFSDYYLDVRLPLRPDWQALAVALAPTMARVAAIYAEYTPSNNEAQAERDLVRPILEALGHLFEVQASLRTSDGTKKPDYVFYRDANALNANKSKVLTEALLANGGVAVGDAKAWELPLDMTSKTKSADPLSNKNPSYQIAFYIQHSGLDWGILTNGRLWRLYHKATAFKLDRYYEVDLPALLKTGDPVQFLYFAAFFGRAAFDPHALGVAALLDASANYALGVGNTLKAQVYEALRHLAQGFLDYPGNKLQDDPATLKLIYDNSLIVLYRLLFVLYAEARELLPVRESRMYRDSYSLRAITHDIANNLRLDKHLLPSSATIWPRLRALFGIIDEGSPPLDVATFNGGLFDPARHPFLERHTVGDARLQAAVDKLARVKDEFVDYRDLAERHLGTIYEGLLEFHLAIIPREGEWTVALLNDRGERKATGSYYTPDYIVQYIVEQTIGPVLREAVADKETDAAKTAAVLGVNVLDPAMGSGHFPVAATEYIARFLVDLAVTPEVDAGGETELAYWKRRVAQNCIYGVDLNPLAVDLAKLSLWLVTVAKDRPLSFLDHHLRNGNALVGARLADLQVGGGGGKATKQPKVSEQRVRQQAAAGQLSMHSDPAFRQSLGGAVNAMWTIEETAGDTVAEVKAQERAYEQLRADLNQRYGKLADIATATRFGLVIDAALWTPLTDFATGRGNAPLARTATRENISALARFTTWLDQAAVLAADHHFFHWELEFPEVYFDRTGQPLGAGAGFDAVIGNPPYVRQEQMAPYKPYFASEYRDTYHGVADLYVYFFDQGLRQLRHGGRLSYICSNSWLRANYATPLRAFLRAEATVETIIDIGDNRVFADAPDVYPAIHIIRREPPAAEQSAQVAVFTRGEGIANFAAQVAAKSVAVSIHDQTDSGWQLTADGGREIVTKLMAKGKPLGDVVNHQMFRGVLTGLNDAFIIDTVTRNALVEADPACAELIKPMLRGEDLRPWYQEDEGRWLIFTRRGIDIDDYPAIKAHLEKFRTQLEPRPHDWQGSGVWPGRKVGNYKWYEIQDSVDYYAAFDQPKILWPDIAKFPRFSWDSHGAYINDKGFLLVPNTPYILGLLQSRSIWLCISQLCVPLGERAGLLRYQQKSQFISRLPIPDARPEQRDAIAALALAITEQSRARYALHEKTRHRIGADLGNPGKGLNQKLTAWWTLDFPAFRAELLKVFKGDIAVKERDDWEGWLKEQRAAHQRHTAEIVRLETDLNARVYALFDLTPAEIAIIEESTAYRYGEV
jgi:hypothetical protein